MKNLVGKNILSPDPLPDISFSDDNGIQNQTIEGEYIENNIYKEYNYGSLWFFVEVYIHYIIIFNFFYKSFNKFNF